MDCPNCKKSYYFISANNTKKCSCSSCGYTGVFVPVSYEGYHSERYSYRTIRTKKNDPLYAEIFKRLIFNKNDKVLDYGCGAGDLTWNISKLVNNAIGSDINIDRAQSRFKNLKFIRQKDFRLSSISDNYFDIIFSINVIEHIPNFEGMLREITRILRPGGKLFLTTYDTNFFLHNILNDPTHVIEWDKQEFERLISKYFKICESFRSGSFFNYKFINKFIVNFLKPELCILAEKI